MGTSADSGRFNMLAQILSARPTGGLKLTDEELLNSAIDPEMLETGESLAQVNPVMQTESVTNDKRGEMWSANASVTWQIIKGLTLRQLVPIIQLTAELTFFTKQVLKKHIVMEKSRMAELKWDATYVGLIIITSHGNKRLKNILMM